MKIFRTEQIRKIDEFTIRHEPVRSVDLMERAAEQLLKWHVRNFERNRRVLVFTGPGNNGGDGLALARLLSVHGYTVEVFHLKISERTSEDWAWNFQRLKNETALPFKLIESTDQFPLVGRDDVIIDAIFGCGLTRPISGLASEIVKMINHAVAIVISVDIPSGLFGEDNSDNDPESIINADFTLSFEFPKLSFMFPENAKYVGEWKILPIGLHPVGIMSIETPYSFIEDRFIYSLLKKREKFDHKGKYGHGLLVAGSFGKMGAAILGAKAALKTGIGLVTCHVPRSGYQVIQTAVPESMVVVDNNDQVFSGMDFSYKYNALGIGPGLGTTGTTMKAFSDILLNYAGPLVIDADAINILGINRDWLSSLPANTILTPHVKEFERIAGASENSFARLVKQVELSGKYNCVLLVKGAYSIVTTPDGRVNFNSTGNPGMATAGSGDVLTGIILSLLAQGYEPGTAALVGTYIHGLAGDIAVRQTGPESLIASDIIDNIGRAFSELRENNDVIFKNAL